MQMPRTSSLSQCILVITIINIIVIIIFLYHDKERWRGRGSGGKIVIRIMFLITIISCNYEGDSLRMKRIRLQIVISLTSS